MISSNALNAVLVTRLFLSSLSSLASLNARLLLIGLALLPLISFITGKLSTLIRIQISLNTENSYLKKRNGKKKQLEIQTCHIIYFKAISELPKLE